jgi:hypothetical protein
MAKAHARLMISLALFGLLPLTARAADTTFFSTGNPDGKIATASRPDAGGATEIESADDFVLSEETSITDATFTGLLSGGATPSDVGEVVVEIYRVFPALSDVGRTSGPPTFSTTQVPTRVNSPSDVALDSRDSTSGLTFMIGDLGSFTVGNSVTPGGINSFPNQTTGGDGRVTGDEVQFGVTFSTPLVLPAGHYFFVPQVEVSGGDFLWLSAPRPIAAPGTPFPSGVTDLQSWTRDEALDPDWLRVGADIVGGTPAPTFNAAFSLSGSVVPEPSTWVMLLLGFAGLGFAGWRRVRNPSPASA